MEQLSKNIGMICVIIVVAGIVFELGKFKSTEKSIRFIIVVYIVVTVFKTFGASEWNIDYESYKADTHYAENSYIFKDTVIFTAQQELEEIIKNRLNEKNISYNSVSVHILEQNGIAKTDKIYVQCDDDLKDDVFECIEDIIGEDTEIIIGE